MPDYERLYFQLFAAIENAVRALEECNYGAAKKTLISAQQCAEEAYISAEK